MSRMKFFGAAIIAAVFAGMVYSPQLVRADGMPGNSESDGSRSPGTEDRTGSYWPKGSQPKDDASAGAFAGTWYAFVDNTAFTIIIEQDGRIIKAAHTAVYDYGRRVDSSVGSVSMSGVVEGSTAFMEWKSGLSPETGKATLEYLAGRPVTLHWRIVEKPKKAEDDSDTVTTEVAYFLPKTAFLTRK